VLAKKALTLFLVLTAVSLILYAVAGLSIGDLARLLAFSLGLTILFVIAYPYLYRVKVGDEVVVVANSLVPSFLGRKGVIVRSMKEDERRVVVRLDDGSEVVGILESGEELFSPPRVRLIYEERVE